MQRMPLEFDRTVGTSLVWNNGSVLTTIKDQVYVSDPHVWPRGSVWARNPVPRLMAYTNGLHGCSTNASCDCPGPLSNSGPGCEQFPAPCAGDIGREEWSLRPPGQGHCSGDWTQGLIMDKVIIPPNLKKGHYVLGWRWDCEGKREGATSFSTNLRTSLPAQPSLSQAVSMILTEPWSPILRLQRLLKYGKTVQTLRSYSMRGRYTRHSGALA